MPDLIGKTVRLPPELWDELAKQAKTMDRSVNYVIIQAVRDHVLKVVPDVSKMVSSQYQSGTNVVPTPSPAPAREQKDIILPSLEDERVDPIADVAELISSLDWQGGELPKKTTPLTLAESLVTTYDGIDVAACVREAHSDMVAKGRVVKALGRYLVNWMKNEKNPPAWKKERDKPGQRNLWKQPTKQSEQQDYTKGAKSDGTW